MKIRIVIFIFFVSSITVFCQNKVVIDWSSNTYYEKEIIDFPSAVYLKKFHGLPAFQILEEVDNLEINKIKISKIKFTEVNDDEILNLEKLNLKDTLIYNSEILRSQKNNFHRIIVFPYIKNSEGYKRILEFSYEIIKEKYYPKIKSNSTQKIQSVLNQGNWYKISLSENGIYQLTFNDLEKLGMNTDNIDINNIRLFGNSGGMLPKLNSEFRHEDLQENAIEIIDINNNGVFESDDRIIFYGQSPDVWKKSDFFNKYNFHKNLYEDYNYYFLTLNSDGNPKRIVKRNDQNIYTIISDFNAHLSHELDLVNFIQSGSEWYGEEFDVNLVQNFNFDFPNISDNVYVDAEFATRSFSQCKLLFSHNGSVFAEEDLGVVGNGYLDDYVSLSNISGVIFNPNDNFLDIEITFERSSPSYKSWLNYLQLNTKRDLYLDGDQMYFRKWDLGDLNDNFTFEISNCNSDFRVWDVTDPINIFENQLFSYNNTDVYMFNHQVYLSEDSEWDNEFILFRDANFMSPNLIGKIDNQNLHGDTDFEMLIISSPDFFPTANKLSDFHFQNDGSKCKVVTPQQIFNEFSSGKSDVTSIRDYCRYLYNLDDSEFKYLMLLGDASYDPKNRIETNNNNIITYQSENSYDPLNTFATDDYFGFLDENEGLFDSDLLDIGIGRLPASTIQEAENMVDKIIHYHNNESRGSWRNHVTFIADDGDDSDGNIHMQQADNLCAIIDEEYNNYNFNKFYLDIYNQESTPVGPRSPDCKDEINRRIGKGTFLVNYTGHGGESGLTKERIIEIDQITNWDNFNKLPLFVTATCEFGRFDNPEMISGGEHIILNKDGGGVGLLTTTRYVYSHLNYNLNTNFINSLFEKNTGEYPRIGDVFLRTKNLSGSSINNNKFILLGDPLMKLSYPDFTVITNNSPDTISALGRYIFDGIIVDNDSNMLLDFDGEIDITVFDKKIVAQTQGQQSSTPMNYNKQDNIIYRGTSTVENGNFTFSFIVPKDIDYTIGNGRISYYAIKSNDNSDASGWHEDFYVGGVSNEIIDDQIGPSIELYMNDEQFVSGSITNSDPVFLALIIDSSGVNTLGNGIGHDITITINGDESNKVILNDYYQADTDSYQRGKIEYPLNNLEEGLHTIKFKVWDVFNNSSESTIEFIVANDEEFYIKNLLNYPNPFSNNTNFYFEHNRPNQNLEVQIQIYTVSGKLIKTINYLQTNFGFRVGPIFWDGRDDFLDKIGRGTYVYKLKVKDESGELVQKLEKLVILN
tara:strand:+ start:17115 stop:20882 length:3768 start_codon:yes stop_codon:yes gene_type:complete